VQIRVKIGGYISANYQPKADPPMAECQD